MKQTTVVLAAIIENNKIFLIKENWPGSKWNGKWGLPGGKINHGEDPEAAVVREVKEETNLDVEISELMPKIHSVNFSAETQFIYIIYKCKKLSGNFIGEAGKVTDGRFFSRQEINFNEILPVDDKVIEYYL